MSVYYLRKIFIVYMMESFFYILFFGALCGGAGRKVLDAGAGAAAGSWLLTVGGVAAAVLVLCFAGWFCGCGLSCGGCSW